MLGKGRISHLEVRCEKVGESRLSEVTVNRESEEGPEEGDAGGLLLVQVTSEV